MCKVWPTRTTLVLPREDTARQGLGLNAGGNSQAAGRATKIKGTPAEFMDKHAYRAAIADSTFAIRGPDGHVAVSLQRQMGVTVSSRLPSVLWRAIDPVDAVLVIVDRHSLFELTALNYSAKP